MAAPRYDLAAREASDMCPKCLGPTGPLGTRIQAVPLADIAHLRASPARAACEQSCLCATKIASALTFCSMPMNPAAQSPGARHFPADLLDVAGLAAKDQEGRQRGGVGYSRPPTAPNEAGSTRVSPSLRPISLLMRPNFRSEPTPVVSSVSRREPASSVRYRCLWPPR